MTQKKLNKKFSSKGTKVLFCLGIICYALLFNTGCSSSKPDLRALKHQALQDSLFLEYSFKIFTKQFPLVDLEDFYSVAKGKPRNYCLFQKLHILECTDLGDHEYKYGRSASAKEAYKAAALTSEYNSSRRNVRLYGALTQIALEEQDMYTAQIYISKILFLNEKNKWAKQKLISVLSSKD